MSSKANILLSLREGGENPTRVMCGETVHVNHKDCPAGEDARRRLYVTRNKAPADLMVWYCHNCGEGGAFKCRINHVLAPSVTDPVGSGMGILNVKDLWEQGVPWNEAPDEVVAWLKHRGTMVGEVWDNSIRWHPVKNALLFGVRERGQRYEPPVPPALQVRNFGTKGGPKWWTCKGKWPADTPLRTWFGINQEFLGDGVKRQERALFIVEDWLSAAAVWHYSAHDSYCLYGAHLGMDELAKLRHELRYDKLVVWLDNDVKEVVKSREDIVKRAKMLGFHEVRIERERADPKYHSAALASWPLEDYPLA